MAYADRYKPYTYTRLQGSRPETRVFKLEPVKDALSPELLSFRMRHIYLNDDIDYYAISYACGDISKRRPVLADGCIHYIYESLEIVLRSFTNQFPHRLWWADAISINQGDLAEKGYQVGRIGEVYSRARMTMVWLAPGNMDSLEAIIGIVIYGGIKDRLEDMRKEIDDTATDASSSRLRNQSLEDLRLISEAISQLPNSTLEKIVQLLQSTWWRRLWTLQEACLAKKVGFFCGEYQIGYKTMTRAYAHGSKMNSHELSPPAAFYTLYKQHHVSALLVKRMGRLITTRAIREKANGLFSLMLIINTLNIEQEHRVLSFVTTDPRDQVFALLGLIGDREDIGIKPDYSNTTEEVFINMTKSIIANGIGNVLVYCNSYCTKLNLPSWTHDWSRACSPYVQSTLFHLNYVLNSTAVRSGTTITEDAVLDANILSLMGFHRDKIEGVAGTTFSDLFVLDDAEAGRVLRNSLLQLMDLSTRLYPEAVHSTANMEAYALLPIKGLQWRSHGRYERAIVESASYDFRQILNSSNHIEASIPPRGYINTVRLLSSGHRPFITASGLLGLGPEDTREGDEVVSLYGVTFPMIVRKRGVEECHSLVGSAYVHNIDTLPRTASDRFYRLV